jgi:rubrerythrin
MKKNDATRLGTNRTGIAASPVDAAKLAECAEMYDPPPGDEMLIAEVREDYQAEAEPIGSLPPPANLKGLAKSAMKMLKGERPTVLIDKLGERCTYERTGVRLYQLLLSRFEAFGEGDVELRRFLADEARHFQLLVDCSRSLGADPTAMTPCADTTTVMAHGIVQVLSDPRTSATQCLNAALVVELTDRDGWELLIELARAMGQDDMADQFVVALAEEENHLAHVRRWLAEMTLDEARVEPTERMVEDPLLLLREQQRRMHELLVEVMRRRDGDETAVLALASELQDEIDRFEAVGQELLARSL